MKVKGLWPVEEFRLLKGIIGQDNLLFEPLKGLGAPLGVEAFQLKLSTFRFVLLEISWGITSP